MQANSSIFLITCCLSLLACGDGSGDAWQPPQKVLAGDYYSVMLSDRDDSEFAILKVLAVDRPLIHIRLFAGTYKTRPSDVALEELSMGDMTAPISKPDARGVPHEAVREKDFLHWKPVLVGHAELSADEQSTLNAWRTENGADDEPEAE